MLKWFWAWEHKTVDTIVAAFHSVVDELHAHAAALVTEAIDATQKAAEHEEIARVASKEAERAREIAIKLKGLIS